MKRLNEALREGRINYRQSLALLDWLDALDEPRYMTAIATVPGAPSGLKDHGEGASRGAPYGAETYDPAGYLHWLTGRPPPGYYPAIITQPGSAPDSSRPASTDTAPGTHGDVQHIAACLNALRMALDARRPPGKQVDWRTLPPMGNASAMPAKSYRY